MFRPNKFKIRPLFAQSGIELPNFYHRIDENIQTTGVNIVLIEGKSQTGKSTLAKHIAERYDPNYTLVYTVDDVLNRIRELKDLWFARRYKMCKYRWLFWDEPECEIPKAQFWSERNSVIQSITSSFGFLKPSLVMALPNIKGLSDLIITNVLLRISISAKLKKGKIIRKGWVRTSYFDERRQKFRWRLVEEHTIPILEDITKDRVYMKAKVNNFFNTQMERWQNKINKQNRSEMPFKEEISNLTEEEKADRMAKYGLT